MYMDDVTFVVRGKRSVGRVLEHMEEYGRVARARLSRGKSNMWGIGKWEGLK